ncbi:MAG: copper resistance protein CopC [Nitrososphaeraceae archaeon]|nr:copper resistance protein CopC [Nitrososphaeraceae archaeon]
MFKHIITKDSVAAVVSFLVVIIIVATTVTFYSSPAYGHANPVSYSPSANAVIISQQQENESLPDKVVILFSERPEPKVSYIHVTNSKNERVDNNDFKITGKNDREATVTLDTSKLSNGVYTVSWLVLSRDDGHITKGSYVFNIQSLQQQQSSQQGMILTGQQNNGNIFSESSTVDNVNVTLKITPFYVGQNTFNVTLTDQSGTFPTNIRNVILSFTNQDVGIGPIVATLNKTGEGKFAAQGNYLSQPGNWDIKVTAQRSGAYDLNHTFESLAKAPSANKTSP